MILARSDTEFRSHPDGTFVAGESWLYFVMREGVHGYALWGTPTEGDVGALVHRLELELLRPPHPALVDLSGLEHVEVAPFGLLASFVAAHTPALAAGVLHSAFVLPRGMNRAIATGFFHVTEPPFPLSYWDDVSSALAHVGHPAPARATDELLLAKSLVTGVSPLVRRLRQHLEQNLLDATLPSTARGLAVSERSLQRSLASAATTFVSERESARIRLAERLLVTTSDTVTQIAATVGTATPAQFSALFKKLRGETPTEFRARTQRAAKDPR